MKRLPKEQYVNTLWAKGRNPIHLFGNVYLVRHESTQFSKIPFYVIRIIED